MLKAAFSFLFPSYFGKLKFVSKTSPMPEGNYGYKDLLKIQNCVPAPYLKWFWKANLAICYIELIRKISNKPSVVDNLAKIERRIIYLFDRKSLSNVNTRSYIQLKSVFKIGDIAELRKKTKAAAKFKSPYVKGSFNRGDLSNHTSFWNFEDDFMQSDAFIRIVCNQKLIESCQEVLGKKAKITWIWLWHTKAHETPAMNQLWHRDSAEPLNFQRVFIPLTNIKSNCEGPTHLIPGSEKVNQAFLPRRHEEWYLQETGLLEHQISLLSNVGDAYIANTFALHKGLAVTKTGYTRSMLSLLVSPMPSQRTASLPKFSRSIYAEETQRLINQNSYWLTNIIAN